jgi:hypothetical protein
MENHVDKRAQRGEEPMKIQPMVLTNPPGKKHSNDIFDNETLL